MKKVLVIAYIYPPIGGSGVQRTLKFTRYLPQFGWQPVVVCGDDGEVFKDGYDPSLLAEIPPEVAIHRAPFRSPLALRRWMHKALRMKGGAPRTAEGRPAGRPIDPARPSLPRQMMRVLCAPLAPFEFPPVDAALYWAISIVPLCLRIIRQEQVDVIFSTSFPYSDHVTGYLLKRLTGLPWVADFRDPWTQNAAAGNSGWRRRIDERVERAVLTCADRVIGATPSYTDGLRQIASHLPPWTFSVIENGYDPQDFLLQDLQGRPAANGKVTLAHVGMAYSGTVLPLFEAVRRMPDEDQARLKLRFIGGLPQAELGWLSGHALKAEVEILGRLPHANAVDAMCSANALFLPTGEGTAWAGHYPGKLFEYIACGVPVLQLGGDGDTARLIRLTGTGLAVSSTEMGKAVSALQELVQNPDMFRSCYYAPNLLQITRYERKNLTQRLALVFDTLAGEKKALGTKTIDRHALP